MFEPRDILCYVSPGEGRSAAVHRAADITRASRDASLTLIGVVEPVPAILGALVPSSRPLAALVETQLSQELDDLVAGLADEGLPAQRVLRRGQPAEEITRQVVEQGHDLVIKLARGDDDRMIGDTARRLMRTCPAPVWVVHPGPAERRRVAAAVDPHGDPELQQRIVSTARRLASSFGASLHIVHAWELPSAHLLASRMQAPDFAALRQGMQREVRQGLDELLAAVPGALDAESVHLLEGHHSRELLRFLADEAVDLLVMGTVSRTSLARMVVGCTAERVLSQVGCSVLVLKPSDAPAAT